MVIARQTKKGVGAMNKTQKRVAWIKENWGSIEQNKTEVTPNPGVTVGNNARYFSGMISGMGWWIRAFALAGFGTKIDHMDCWDGPAPTPSQAMNKGMMVYVLDNCPEELK